MLPLTDPTDIGHARAVIADPGSVGGHLVVARIARGGVEGDYVNADLINDGRVWSWRVVEFLGFADMTIEILDGSPLYVEEHLDWWFENTGGVIGFWSYRAVREIAPDDPAAMPVTGVPGLVSLIGALAFLGALCGRGAWRRPLARSFGGIFRASGLP